MTEDLALSTEPMDGASPVDGTALRRHRPTDITSRLDILDQAVSIADGRLGASAVAGAQAVLSRARERLQFSGEHTVVAVGGATGSGKSSLFNAITGLELAEVGIRRPTTAHALSCVWGEGDAQPLLDWLGIPARYRLRHESALDEAVDTELAGLVLLDLPDHDSTEVTHQIEVDRLVQLVDLLVWVVDPQKYADRVLHERYLRPLAAHRDVVVLVLNRVDELRADEVRACQEDLEKLAAADGLDGVRVLATSAITGVGIDAFRATLADAVQHKRSTAVRLAGDAVRSAGRLADDCGDARVPQIDPGDKEELVDAFAHAGGVPIVVDAVARSYRARAARAVGWPPLRWLSRLRRDPLRRLRTRLRKGHQGPSGDVDPDAIRASLPEPTPVQRARVATAARRVVDSAVHGLTEPWVTSIRTAARSREAELEDALDQAIVGTDLGVAHRPRWWTAIGVLQWVLLAMTTVGLGWLGGWAVARVGPSGEPASAAGWLGVPPPVYVVAVGALAGIVLALVSRAAARIGAHRRAKAARERMVEAIRNVAGRLVFTAVENELEAYRTCRDALAAVQRR